MRRELNIETVVMMKVTLTIVRKATGLRIAASVKVKTMRRYKEKKKIASTLMVKFMNREMPRSDQARARLASSRHLLRVPRRSIRSETRAVPPSKSKASIEKLRFVMTLIAW
jgi:hypothetical protein